MSEQNRYVVCLSNAGYEASLEPRKLYRAIPDSAATKLGLIRVIDESGDDYLFADSMFATVSLRKDVKSQLAKSA